MTTISAIEYNQLIQRMVASNTPAVVLGDFTVLVNDTGVVSTLGGNQLNNEQLELFKLWLIKEYGDKI